MTALEASRAPLPGPLVSAEWLYSHSEEVTVVDVRWYLDGRSGRQAYDGGHIPGAFFVDLDSELSSAPTPSGGRHPLPSPEAFASVLGALGVGETSQVVVYDDAGGSIAARLWWLLRSIGQEAAVLDGGIAAWSHPLATEEPPRLSVARVPRPWPSAAFVDTDEVARASRFGEILLDARSASRYAHGDPAIDTRPGHIPGARSAPWAGNLDATGRFLSPGALRGRFLAAGASAGERTIAYCGSGVTACHDLLALTIAGFASIALYPGSWSAWSADPERPVEEAPPE